MAVPSLVITSTGANAHAAAAAAASATSHDSHVDGSYCATGRNLPGIHTLENGVDWRL